MNRHKFGEISKRMASRNVLQSRDRGNRAGEHNRQKSRKFLEGKQRNVQYTPGTDKRGFMMSCDLMGEILRGTRRKVGQISD